MRVLFSTWGSRGDVEPIAALAVQLQSLGAQARVCAPPDFAERFAEIGVEMVPMGLSVRALVHGKETEKPVTPADAPRVAAALVASHFEMVGPRRM
jgi:vancomycin aglycone glucosyltransferase